MSTQINSNGFYELKLIKLIANLRDFMSVNYDDHETINFFRNQERILQYRLEKLQSKMDPVPNNTFIKQEATIDTTNFSRIDEEYEEENKGDNNENILRDHFDHPEEENNKYYSLRAWFQEYLKVNFQNATNLATTHCMYIKQSYLDMYSSNPVKICKEWLYKNGEQYKEVVVNSYNRNEFEKVIRPYIDGFFEAESRI